MSRPLVTTMALLAGVSLSVAGCAGATDDASSPTAAPTDAQIDDASPTTPTRMGPRGLRYCEILLTVETEDGPVTQVWGTQGVNLCPQEVWDAIDPQQVADEFDATGVVMNGPRVFVIDGSVETGTTSADTAVPDRGARRTYGDLEMKLLAEVDLADDEPAYERTAVARTATWSFNAGSEIYVLTDPDGDRYVMQSYSQIADPTLDVADLPTLGDRLALPDGWSFEAMVLEERLVLELATPGQAVVVQDDLTNTYQQW